MNESMGEFIVVLMIVGAVVVLGVRSVYRLMAGQASGKCCGCSSCTCKDANGQDGGENFLNTYRKET